MPRRPRVFVEGGIYHVYNRFARGPELFSEPEEAISRWASRGAEMRMGLGDFSADFERLDQTLAAGRRVAGKSPRNR